MNSAKIDMGEFKAFFQRIKQAAKGGFKKDLELFLEGLGVEFLEILENEIIRKDVQDSRLLLNSFHKGIENNVWELSEGGLTLEVGTNLEYAGYVNDGHWTNPKGVERRFVPGDVITDSSGKVIKFTYNHNSDTGIILKQKWVEGKHYWESALYILETYYPQMLEKKLADWIDEYFANLK
ncbi:MAG: HK97 gp10 family phage protein [Oscillospiraceae bacterium]